MKASTFQHPGIKAAARIFLVAALLVAVPGGTGNLIAAGKNSNNGNGNGNGSIEGLPNGANLCQIILTQTGSLGASYDATAIGSAQPGGREGIANVTATRGSYSLAIDPPATFSTAPLDGNNGVTFKAYYSGTGDTNFGSTPATIPVRLKKGATRVSTHISATKFGDTFPAGDYQAELIMRCE